MLTVTDGVQTVEAMECEPISSLPDVIKPGCKIQITGPVTVRRGIICLKEGSVRLLGGEVEEMQEKFSLKKILQQKIRKDEREQVRLCEQKCPSSSFCSCSCSSSWTSTCRQSCNSSVSRRPYEFSSKHCT